MRPLSSSSLSVALAIRDGIRHGFDIMDHTGLPSGTVYPVLSRLNRAGLVDSQWEDAAIAQDEHRPPRRYYELTQEGHKRLEASVAHYATLTQGTAPARSRA